MMPLRVRNIEIGEDMPKICVPIVGVTKKEIISEIKEIRSTKAELVEWRVDWFEDVLVSEEVLEVLSHMRHLLNDIPLLFTFRSFREGGNCEVTDEVYENLNHLAISSGAVDLVDVELFFGQEMIARTKEKAHEAGVKIVVSNHDFHVTPPKKEMIKRLTRMNELGADIAKLAVMPADKQDLLNLMSATIEAVALNPDCPIVTMSMAQDGMLSRLCGEITGSAITFGSLKKASAPGQIAVADLSKILQIIHKQIEENN